MKLFLVILFGQYCFFYDSLNMTLLLQYIFVFLFFRVLLESQKAGKLCANMFSFILANFWASCSVFISEQSVKWVYFIYAIIMTLFQYYFTSFTIHDQLSKKLSQLITTLILFSLFLLLIQPVTSTIVCFLIHMPFIQIILLIASY